MGATIVNNIDMAYDSELEFRKMIQEKLEADARKQAERTERYRASQYGGRTCMAVNDKFPNPPQRNIETVSRKSPEQQEIERLVLENQTLKTENQKLLNENRTAVTKYNDLLDKAGKIVEAYKKQQTEVDKLNSKKAKQEIAAKALADVGKRAQTTWDKIILWFKT